MATIPSACESGGFCEVADEVVGVRGRDLIEAGLSEAADGRRAMGNVVAAGGPSPDVQEAPHGEGPGRSRPVMPGVGGGGERTCGFERRRTGLGVVGKAVEQGDPCQRASLPDCREWKNAGGSRGVLQERETSRRRSQEDGERDHRAAAAGAAIERACGFLRLGRALRRGLHCW